MSYVIGARSRQYAVPHAGDALFALMLERVGAVGSELVQLGLGVNAGITRFKRKWGAEPQLPYVMAQWQERPRSGGCLLGAVPRMMVPCRPLSWGTMPR